LRERGRSDDNDARAFLLSNASEERAELLWIVSDWRWQRDRNARARGRF